MVLSFTFRDVLFLVLDEHQLDRIRSAPFEFEVATDAQDEPIRVVLAHARQTDLATATAMDIPALVTWLYRSNTTH